MFEVDSASHLRNSPDFINQIQFTSHEERIQPAKIVASAKEGYVFSPVCQAVGRTVEKLLAQFSWNKGQRRANDEPIKFWSRSESQGWYRKYFSL